LALDELGIDVVHPRQGFQPRHTLCTQGFEMPSDTDVFFQFNNGFDTDDGGARNRSRISKNHQNH